MAIDHHAVPKDAGTGEATGTFARWLAQRIQHAPTPEERYRAACLSWTARRPRLTNALLGRVRDRNEHHLIRGVCLENLASSAAWHHPKSRLDRKVHRTILESLEDPLPNVRFWACYAAGTLRLQAARSRLDKLSHDEGLGDMGWSIAYEAEQALENIRTGNGWNDDRIPGENPYPPLDAP